MKADTKAVEPCKTCGSTTADHTEPAVACRQCSSVYRVRARYEDGGISAPLVVNSKREAVDWFSASPIESWFCEECNTRSTNRDTIAVVVEVPAPLADEEPVDDEELAQLRSDPRDHGDGCNANCWCWS